MQAEPQFGGACWGPTQPERKTCRHYSGLKKMQSSEYFTGEKKEYTDSQVTMCNYDILLKAHWNLTSNKNKVVKDSAIFCKDANITNIINIKQ